MNQKNILRTFGLVHYRHRIITRLFPDLLEKLNALEDCRKQPDYVLAEILMASIAMFILQMGSRNAFQNQSNERKFKKNFKKLFGPGTDSKKLFDRFRYQGYVLVAADATGAMSFDKKPDDQALHKASCKY